MSSSGWPGRLCLSVSTGLRIAVRIVPWRLVHRFLICACCLSLVGMGQAEQDPLEFAGVFNSSYSESAEDLSLDSSGVEKAQALVSYYRALRFEAEGKSAQAISAFEKTLKLAPGNPRIARRAAEMIQAAGAGMEGGKNLLEAALAASPKDPEAKLHLSAFLAAYGDGEDRARAIELAEQTVKEHPTHPRALEHYVGLRVAAGQRSTAAMLINKLTAEDPEASGRFWLAMARASKVIWPQKKGDAKPPTPAAKMIRGRIDGYYAHALRLSPNDLLIVSEAAGYFRDTGRLASAVKVYETLLSKRADLLNERFILATYYRDLGRADDAIQELEKLAVINPGDPGIRILLVDLYEGEGEFEKAIPHAETAIGLQGGSENDLLRFGRLLEKAGLKERWLSHAERIVKVYPHSPHGGFMLGNALSQAGEFARAAEVFRKTVIYCQAYDRSRLDTEYYVLYGKALEGAGELQEAERILLKGLDAIPKGSPIVETVPLLSALANVQRGLEKREDALKNLRRAHSAAPDDKELSERLKAWEKEWEVL